MFVQQWNNHGLRTEYHASPIQKFVSGALELQNSNLTAVKDLFTQQSADEVFNQGWDPDIIQNGGLSAVEVPSISCPLSSDNLAQLVNTIPPLEGIS